MRGFKVKRDGAQCLKCEMFRGFVELNPRVVVYCAAIGGKVQPPASSRCPAFKAEEGGG